jgi:ribonuclease PH
VSGAQAIERRPAGRGAATLRPTRFDLDIQRQAAGSVLVATGNTRVICAASVAEEVPRWMRDQGRGWVTAEYGMLPGSGDSRIARRPSGRGTEIQRLIGRSLRAVIDLEALDGFTVTVDCDVLDADGGTRTASITGAWVALHLAFQRLLAAGKLTRDPLRGQAAAVSVGLLGGVPLLDLDYLEDRDADVDMNIVGTADGGVIEVQGTAEGTPFRRAELDALIDLALAGIAELCAAQRAAVLDVVPPRG